MEFQVVVLAVVVNLLLSISPSYGQAPWFCNDETILRNATEVQGGKQKYKIRPSAPMIHQGGKLTITLSSLDDTIILGYYVHAKSVKDSRILGRWTPVANVSETVSCVAEGDTITHTSSNKRTHITLTWNAPNDFLGPVLIRALIFENFHLHWRYLEFPVIEIVPDNVGPINHSECGKVSLNAAPLIVKGQAAQEGQWPWHVALYYYKRVNSEYICGGSLVSEWHVVTAAHCVTERSSIFPINPETLTVYLGKFNLRRTSESVQIKLVRNIHIYPLYNHSTLAGDLAVLKFSSSCVFSLVVRPICLWKNTETSIDKIISKQGVVVGWGFDEFNSVKEELSMVRMPVVSEATCLRSYPEFFTRFTSSGSYCAGFANGSSVCNGDSGGGMVFPEKAGIGRTPTWYLRGLVSLSATRMMGGLSLCDTYHYAVFTDVAQYLNWIKDILTT